MRLQQESQFSEACNHPTIARQDRGFGVPAADAEGGDGEIPRRKIVTQEGFCKRANSIAVFRVVERETRAPEEGFLGSLFACEAHLEVGLIPPLFQKKTASAQLCLCARNHLRPRGFHRVQVHPVRERGEQRGMRRAHVLEKVLQVGARLKH